MDDEQFQAMIDIHTMSRRVLRAPRRTCASRQEEREEGREVFRKIVNVSSISGTMATPVRRTTVGEVGVAGSRRRSPRSGASSRSTSRVAFGFVETG